MENKYTLGIIKPGAVMREQIDAIIKRIEEAGFTIEERVDRWLAMNDARELYAVHADRPFYESYCSYMASNPVVVMKLKADDAVAKFRKLIGATNPADAAEGTIRKEFGISIEDNVIHGSDSEENAIKELAFFFGKDRRK